MFRTLKLHLLHKMVVGFTAERFIVHTVRKGAMNDAVSTNKAVTIQEKARLCLRWLDEDACLRKSAPIWFADLAARVKFFRFNVLKRHAEVHFILKDILETFALSGFSSIEDLIKNVLSRKYPRYLYDWLLEDPLAVSWLYALYYNKKGVTEDHLYEAYSAQISYAAHVILSVLDSVSDNLPYSIEGYSMIVE